MGTVKKFFLEVISSSLIDSAKAILFVTLGIIVSFGSSQVTLNKYQLSGPIFWMYVSFFTILGAWASIILFEKIKGNRPVFGPIDSNFSYREFNISMKYLGRTSLVYKKQKKLTAQKDNVRKFIDKYCWTGDKDMEITCENVNHELRSIGRSNVWTIYEIDLLKSFKIGEDVDVGVAWNLTDTKKEFVPFISAVVEHPTKRLTLKLDAEIVKGSIGDVFVEVSSHLGSNAPYETIQIAGNNGVYIYENDNPKLLHHYEMRWKMVD